ncbi:MAG: hypothetical protein KAI17_15215, partial [Thiotrichaceae bacterium]|nr:hypothetical protein [Thiotrichaceae bacterium]
MNECKKCGQDWNVSEGCSSEAFEDGSVKVTCASCGYVHADKSHVIFEDGTIKSFDTWADAEEEAEYYNQIRSIVVDDETMHTLKGKE